MANKSGYYYLRLKENFFDSEELKLIESMENGYLYSNILLKMYLKALKNDGKLVFNDVIPYNTKMLATITGHNIDVVEKAIKIFVEMHLIEILDNGAIYMMNMQQLIGSISSEGIRKAEYREKIKLEKEQGTKLGQCPDIISISNSNSKSISSSNDKDNNIRHKYGKYGWFLLSEEEKQRLDKEYGKEYIDQVIEILDEQVESTKNKNKYKNWNLVIRKAIRDKWTCLNSIKKIQPSTETQMNYTSRYTTVF